MSENIIMIIVVAELTLVGVILILGLVMKIMDLIDSIQLRKLNEMFWEDVMGPEEEEEKPTSGRYPWGKDPEYNASCLNCVNRPIASEKYPCKECLASWDEGGNFTFFEPEDLDFNFGTEADYGDIPVDQNCDHCQYCNDYSKEGLDRCFYCNRAHEEMEMK